MKAKRLISFVLAAAFMLLAGGLLFPRQVVACFLTPGESFEMAVQYLRIVAPGYLFSAINGAMKRSYTSNEAHILAGLSNVQENSQSEPSLVKP